MDQSKVWLNILRKRGCFREDIVKDFSRADQLMLDRCVGISTTANTHMMLPKHQAFIGFRTIPIRFTASVPGAFEAFFKAGSKQRFKYHRMSGSGTGGTEIRDGNGRYARAEMRISWDARTGL